MLDEIQECHEAMNTKKERENWLTPGVPKHVFRGQTS